MKHILTVILFPLAALAIDPSSPVVRIDSNGNIIDRRSAIPDRYESTVNYRGATEAIWQADGWRQATITTITNVETVNIPASIQAVATAYKSALEGIYGAGAATNRNLTREYVAIDLSLRPVNEVSADTGLRLQTWFELLNTYWGKGEIWTFPWGQTSYSVTNVSEVWEAVTP